MPELGLVVLERPRPGDGERDARAVGHHPLGQEVQVGLVVLDLDEFQAGSPLEVDEPAELGPHVLRDLGADSDGGHRTLEPRGLDQRVLIDAGRAVAHPGVQDYRQVGVHAP